MSFLVECGSVYFSWQAKPLKEDKRRYKPEFCDPCGNCCAGLVAYLFLSVCIVLPSGLLLIPCRSLRTPLFPHTTSCLLLWLFPICMHIARVIPKMKTQLLLISPSLPLDSKYVITVLCPQLQDNLRGDPWGAQATQLFCFPWLDVYVSLL